MVVNNRPVPPTAAARYRKSLRVTAAPGPEGPEEAADPADPNELNDLNGVNGFTVLLSICFPRQSAEKSLG
nr:hypothetical protein [Duganella sp. Leaf126]